VQTVTLYVSFDYPSVQTNLRVSASSSPQIGGLQGHAPHCVLVGGALPSGMALDAATCIVSGTPTAAGTFSYVVRLTAVDVQGSIDAQGTITVTDPTPVLVLASGASVDPSIPTLNLQYGQTLAARAVVAFDQRYVAQAGDTVSYAIAAGSLPSGIVLDPSTGRLQGTPTGYGQATAQFVATLVRGGVSYPTQPLGVTINVSTNALQVAYLSPCLVPVGTPLTCTPTFESASALVGVSLRYSSSNLPAGFAIDPVSGVISGTTTTIIDAQPDVIVQGTYPDGSVQTSAAGLAPYLRAVGSWPAYEPAAGDFGLASGPVISPIPGYAYGVHFTPGVSFGIDVSRVTASVAGDVYGYALLPYDTNTPLPSWLAIDAGTGHLFGVAPAGTAPVFWRVQLTLLRGGVTYVSNIALLGEYP